METQIFEADYQMDSAHPPKEHHYTSIPRTPNRTTSKNETKIECH